MKHYGDITKIKGSEVPITDVVCGGSPCQDLSVAGKRAGLAGERSGLYMEQIRIIKEMRNECVRQLSMSGADIDVRSISPRYMVWENVPGAFSSNKGEDFRAVLEEAAKVVDENAVIPGPANGKWPYAGCVVSDGWSLAYSVHDAQYWGVPQRRRRICLLCDFNGDSAPKLLFELRRKAADTASIETITDIGDESRSEVSAVSQSLCGNLEQSGEKGQGTPGTLETDAVKAVSFQERAGCPGGGKGILIANERTASLRTGNNQAVCSWDGSQISPTLTANNAGGNQRMPDKDNFNAVVQSMEVFHCTTEDEKVQTLKARDYKDPQIVCIEGNGSRPSHQGDGYKESDVMYTLNSTEQHAVCEPILLESNQNHATVQTDGVSTTLPASMGMGGGYVPMITDAPLGFNRERKGAEVMVDKCPTIQAAAGTSGNNKPMVCVTYQETTGALMASGYAKLGTQEATNDMYVIQQIKEGE